MVWSSKEVGGWQATGEVVAVQRVEKRWQQGFPWRGNPNSDFKSDPNPNPTVWVFVKTRNKAFLVG